MEYGETPLHAAAAVGSLEVCQELVMAGGKELLRAKTEDIRPVSIPKYTDGVKSIPLLEFLS